MKTAAGIDAVRKRAVRVPRAASVGRTKKAGRGADWGLGEPPYGSERALEIVVVFTGVKQTLAALSTAAFLAGDLGAAIRVVVPQIVPYPLSLGQPPVQRDFIERRFQTLIPSGSIPTRVDVRLCREESAILSALAPNSLVVIGVHSRWWPWSDCRLIRLIRAEGHHVVTTERKASLRGNGVISNA